VEVTWDLNAS